MKFGTGSTTELTQKREGQSTKMPYVRPNIYINKQTSPIFNCVTPVSVSLATLAHQLLHNSLLAKATYINRCKTKTIKLKACYIREKQLS